MQEGDGLAGLAPLDKLQDAAHLTLGKPRSKQALSSVTVNNQGLVDVMQMVVTGVEPKKPCFLATSGNADGSGALVPVVGFMSNPAGSAIVDAVGALRTVLTGNQPGGKRSLEVTADEGGTPVTVLQVGG